MTAFLTASVTNAPGVYYAFENSDNVGKGIVILLLIGSIITWTVLLDKWWSLHRAKRLSIRFGSLFQEYGETNMLTSALLREAENNSGPVAAIYSAGVENFSISTPPKEPTQEEYRFHANFPKPNTTQWRLYLKEKFPRRSKNLKPVSAGWLRW